MKVALVAPGYPPELHGGIEQSTQALAEGLVAAGHRVVVLAGSDAPQPADRAGSDVDTGEALLIRRFHRSDMQYGHWHKRGSPEAGAWFERQLLALRPDVVHVHHWIRLTDDLVLRAALCGIPAVVTLHDLWTSCPLFFRLRPGDYAPCDLPMRAEHCIPCAAQVGPQVTWLADHEQVELLDSLGQRVANELRLARSVHVLSRFQWELVRRTLETTLPLSVLAPAAAGRCERVPAPALPADLGRLVLGSWGGLHPVKGADLLVAALRLLVAAGHPVELRLAGAAADSEFATELRSSAAGLPVDFGGRFADGELARHPVAGAHVMVSATRARETWGLVVDEALALGMPCVLPRSGALPEHLPDGRGALFYEPGDATSLATQLARLWLEPGLLPRLRRELPEPSQVLPPVERHVAAMLGHYRRAIAAGPPPVQPTDDEQLRREWIARWDRGLLGG